MKKIIKYQAEDGQLFETHVDCERYETIQKAKKIINQYFKFASDSGLNQIVKAIEDNPKLFKKLCNFYI